MRVRRAIRARPLSAALAALALLSSAVAAYWGHPPTVSPSLRALARPVAIGAAILCVGTLSALATSVLRVQSEE